MTRDSQFEVLVQPLKVLAILGYCAWLLAGCEREEELWNRSLVHGEVQKITITDTDRKLRVVIEKREMIKATVNWIISSEEPMNFIATRSNTPLIIDYLIDEGAYSAKVGHLDQELIPVIIGDTYMFAPQFPNHAELDWHSYGH